MTDSHRSQHFLYFDDVRSAMAMVEMGEEMAKAPALRNLLKREPMHGNLGALTMESCNGFGGYARHEACTAKIAYSREWRIVNERWMTCEQDIG